MKQVKIKLDKMKYTNHLCLIFLLFSISLSYSQKIESDEQETCIRKKIISFLIENKRLASTEVNNLNSIHISELIDNKVLGYNKNGIYYVTDFSSHNQNYLLLKKGQFIKIVNPLEEKSLIKEVSSFLTESEFSDIESIEYLKAVINIWERNLDRIVDTNFKNQDWIKCE